MASSRRDLCILLLEDDDADAYLTKRELLGIPGVTKIVRARDGREAIAMLDSGQLSPDLAFVDLQMPTMDGLDFLSECLSRGLANVPMVVLTSSSARHDAVRSRVRGAVQVITKPTGVGDLRRMLQEAVETFSPPDTASAADGRVWSLSSLDRGPPAPQTPPPAAARSFGRRDSRALS